MAASASHAEPGASGSVVTSGSVAGQPIPRAVGGGLRTVFAKFEGTKKRTLIHGSPNTFSSGIAKSFKFTPGREVKLALEDPEGDIEVTAAAVLEEAEVFVGRTLLVEKGEMVRKRRNNLAGPQSKKAGHNQIEGHPDREAKGKKSREGENQTQLTNGQLADVCSMMWENALVDENTGLFKLLDEKHEGACKTGEQKEIVTACVRSLGNMPRFTDSESTLGPVEIREACRKYLSGARRRELEQRAAGKPPKIQGAQKVVLGIAGQALGVSRTFVVPPPVATRSIPSSSFGVATNSASAVNLLPLLNGLSSPPSVNCSQAPSLTSAFQAPPSEASVPVQPAEPPIALVVLQRVLPNAAVGNLLAHVRASSAAAGKKRKEAVPAKLGGPLADLSPIEPPKKKLKTKRDAKEVGKKLARRAKGKKTPLVLQSQSRGLVMSAREKAERAEEKKKAVELIANPRKNPSKADKKAKKVAGQAKKVVLEEQENIIKVAKSASTVKCKVSAKKVTKKATGPSTQAKKKASAATKKKKKVREALEGVSGDEASTSDEE